MKNSADDQKTPSDEAVDETVVIQAAPEVEDGVETTETVVADMKLKPDQAESKVDTLMHLEQMIHGYLSDITRLREKMRTQKDMFKQAFEQDKDYSEVAEQQKEVKRKHNEVKQKIAKTDGVSAVKSKIDDVQGELKDAQQSLSDYINRYAELTQATSFTGPGGEVLTIVRTAKLVKKRD